LRLDIFASIPIIDKERLKAIADDTPLARSGDKDGWNYLFDILRNADQSELDALYGSDNEFRQHKGIAALAENSSENNLKPIDSDNAANDNNPSCEVVGFTELDRQPAEYRGRLVRITGKIIRCDKKKDYYVSWILLADKRNIPVCVCSIELPNEMMERITQKSQNSQNSQKTQESQSKKVIFATVTGYFYKRQLCISDKLDEFTTPTILSKSFILHEANDADSFQSGINVTKKQNRFASIEFILILLIVIIAWIVCRSYFNRTFARRRITFQQNISADSIPIPETDSKTDSKLNSEIQINVTENNIDSDASVDKAQLSELLSKIRLSIQIVIVSMTILICGSNNFYADESSKTINVEFARNLFEMSADEWREFGEDSEVSAKYRGKVISFLGDFKSLVSPLVLRREVISFTDLSLTNRDGTTLDQLVNSPEIYRGQAFHVKGKLSNVKRVTLNRQEQNICKSPALYLAVAEVCSGEKVLVLTSFIPDGLIELTERQTIRSGKNANVARVQNNVQDNIQNNIRDNIIDDVIEIFGIYVKRVRVGGEVLGVNFSEVDFGGVEYLPLFISGGVQWYSGERSLVSSLGVDIGLFELSPCFSVFDLREDKLRVSTSLSLLGRAEVIRRGFKLTEADRDPFYGLIRGLRSVSVEELFEKSAQFERGKRLVSVPDLFNDPVGVRGRLVKLTGVAKRILPTIVEDEVVTGLYGIDRYYQIFLYVEGSGEFPIVACVDSLPKGLRAGSEIDYSERISVAAIPYKLWVYDAEIKDDEKEKQMDQEKLKAVAVPLLVGKVVRWFPQKKSKNNAIKFINITIMICVILFFSWLLIHLFWFRVRKTQNIKTNIQLKKL
jgi:hypothetical protein